MSTIFGQIQDTLLNQSVTVGKSFVNIQERSPSMEEAFYRFEDNINFKIRVAIPAKVVSFDAVKQTIVAQPLIQERIVDRSSGTILWVTLPEISDVPISINQGGWGCLTFPIVPGDECDLIFQDLDYQAWWSSGGIQRWMDRRRHDLSDAVAFFGLNSQPNVIQDYSTTDIELRSKDNTQKIVIHKENVSSNNFINLVMGTNNIKIQNNGTVTINCVDFIVNATNDINLSPGASMILKSKDWIYHTHSGEDSHGDLFTTNGVN